MGVSKKETKAVYFLGIVNFYNRRKLTMTQPMDFQNPDWVARALQIHALVSTEVSRCLEKEQDRLFDIEQACNRALKLLKSLDALLGSDIRLVEDYGQKHQALFKLLKKLNLDPSVVEKIAEAFGWNCFFITFFTTH